MNLMVSSKLLLSMQVCDEKLFPRMNMMILTFIKLLITCTFLTQSFKLDTYPI